MPRGTKGAQVVRGQGRYGGESVLLADGVIRRRALGPHEQIMLYAHLVKEGLTARVQGAQRRLHALEDAHRFGEHVRRRAPP